MLRFRSFHSAGGVTVYHIKGATADTLRPYTSMAKVIDGQLDWSG